MKNFYFLLSVFLLDSCVSGKAAYKHGNYYEAVLEAVHRLRSNPDHKKSKEVLNLSYQTAVDFLETETQNHITSNSNDKWRLAVQNYERINTLYEEIKRSPGALRVVPKPIDKYKELGDLKAKAAEESYESGLQAMLKNTREDAKQAFFLFTQANTYNPGYRESIEMIDQSKFNATLKVVVEPSIINRTDWNFEPILYGYRQNQFVKLYSPSEAQQANLQKIDQYISVVVNGYQETRPNTTHRNQEVSDSVKVGEKKVGTVTKPVMQLVIGRAVIYDKVTTAKGSINLVIYDGTSKGVISNNEIPAASSWSDQWATCSGDDRALPNNLKRLCGKKEPYMQQDYLVNQVKRELDSKLSNALVSFYNNY